MLVEGFENAPLVAGEELLALPGFWAANLMWLSQTEEVSTPPVPGDARSSRPYVLRVGSAKHRAVGVCGRPHPHRAVIGATAW